MGLLARLKTKNRSAWSTLFLPNVHLLDKKSGNLSQKSFGANAHFHNRNMDKHHACNMQHGSVFFIAEEDFNHVKLVKILLWGTNALDPVYTN